MSAAETQRVKLAVANPTALGLFGLAIVTFVAASQKLGITTGLSFVIVYAIFLGATAQLIACILDFFTSISGAPRSSAPMRSSGMPWPRPG